MTIMHHHTHWHYCLLSIALTYFASSSPTTVSAFSSRSKRTSTSPKRGGGGETFTSTRRVFCFTLAGGAHNMFSGIRHSAGPTKPSMKQSSTTLHYRAVDDDEWEYCNSSYTDSLWHAALSAPSQQQIAVDASSSTVLDRRPKPTKAAAASKNNGLMETAKAFIPVAVEFGVVAATAAHVHLN